MTRSRHSKNLRRAPRRANKWNSRAVRWPCKDCGREVSPVRGGWRMTWGVKDGVWKRAGMKAQGKRPFGSGEFLCQECLEARLGRALTFADFAYTTRMRVSRDEWRLWNRHDD